MSDANERAQEARDALVDCGLLHCQDAEDEQHAAAIIAAAIEAAVAEAREIPGSLDTQARLQAVAEEADQQRACADGLEAELALWRVGYHDTHHAPACPANRFHGAPTGNPCNCGAPDYREIRTRVARAEARVVELQEANRSLMDGIPKVAVDHVTELQARVRELEDTYIATLNDRDEAKALLDSAYRAAHAVGWRDGRDAVMPAIRKWWDKAGTSEQEREMLDEMEKHVSALKPSGDCVCPVATTGVHLRACPEWRGGE